MTCDYCDRTVMAPDAIKAACGADCCTEECARLLDDEYERDSAELHAELWRDANAFARIERGE